MKTISHKETFLYFILLVTFSSLAQNKSDRELILIDKDWHFSLGHLYDTQKKESEMK